MRFRLNPLMSSGASLLANGFFVLYNGWLWFRHGMPWYICICIYYIILSVIRILLLRTRAVAGRRASQEDHSLRTMLQAVYVLLILMNVALIAPIAVMVRGGRSYFLGLIPAIAMAVYTTYRITAAIIHYRRSRKTNDPVNTALRTINLVDALVAVLSLQNTLICATSGTATSMMQLTAWTSAGILLVIVLITVFSFRKQQRYFRGKAVDP